VIRSIGAEEGTVKERRTWFPYERVELHSPLGIDEVQGRLDSIIEPLRWFQPLPMRRTSNKPFMGELADDGFKVLLRPTRWRRASAPVVIGRITSQGSGTRVAMTFRLHAGNGLSLVLWFCLMLWSQWLLWEYPASFGAASVWTRVALPDGAVAVFLGVVVVLFRSERSRAITLLREALDCPWVGSA
jgi:hypothetical protein